MRSLVFALSMLPMGADAECIARSGPTTAALVELYTSEGCSSCPPADRWLSKLASLPAGKVVPVAFHVTYWDYIGWRDPFASGRHTERQRAFAAAAGARYVYTPQVVLGGRDFRDWPSTGSFEKAVQRINLVPARADLELRIRPIAEGKLGVVANALLKPGVAKDNLVLVLAATQNGLASRVTAGENRGEHLRHDFVVRDFIESRTLAATASFPLRGNWTAESLSVAAFVQDHKTGEVLQALAAPLCR